MLRVMLLASAGMGMRLYSGTRPRRKVHFRYAPGTLDGRLLHDALGIGIGIFQRTLHGG
jgi:hypothetical protein